MVTLKPPYHVGDIVRHTHHFLHSIAWHTEVPINGEIQEVHGPLDGQAEHQVLTVLWSDGNRGNILACNVEFCPRGRQLSARRRQERGA